MGDIVYTYGGMYYENHSFERVSKSEIGLLRRFSFSRRRPERVWLRGYEVVAMVEVSLGISLSYHEGYDAMSSSPIIEKSPANPHLSDEVPRTKGIQPSVRTRRGTDTGLNGLNSFASGL